MFQIFLESVPSYAGGDLGGFLRGFQPRHQRSALHAADADDTQSVERAAHARHTARRRQVGQENIRNTQRQKDH